MVAHVASNTNVTISPVEDAIGHAMLSGSTSNLLHIRISAHMNMPKMPAEKEADTMALDVINIIS